MDSFVVVFVSGRAWDGGEDGAVADYTLFLYIRPQSGSCAGGWG